MVFLSDPFSLLELHCERTSIHGKYVVISSQIVPKRESGPERFKTKGIDSRITHHKSCTFFFVYSSASAAAPSAAAAAAAAAASAFLGVSLLVA